ncbi:hypothetical protein SDC9_160251 [bioreactor metagenome]|uniref:Uncharacterized protein n=1 Tax=bioreactor metagenome TaxID=1076179 RepID=A0A645FEY1_9ZZZZ
MRIDGFEGKIYVPFGRVDAQDLADNLLSFTDVVAQVLDPAGSGIPDVDETLLVVVLIECDESPEILDADD